MSLPKAILAEFTDDDWSQLHDIVFGATEVSKNKDELGALFLALPRDLQLDAAKEGVGDTVVRDNIFEYLQPK